MIISYGYGWNNFWLKEGVREGVRMKKIKQAKHFFGYVQQVTEM